MVDIEDELRYLEIVDCILERRKNLPSWYLNINKSKKILYKEVFLFVLIILAFISSFVNTIFLNGNITTLIIIWVVCALVSHFISKLIAEYRYNKYHNNKK